MVNDVKVTWKRNRYLIPHSEGGEIKIVEGKGKMSKHDKARSA